MKEILKKLATIYAEMRKRGNEALAAAQPIDQAEIQGPIIGALREFEWMMARIKESGEMVETYEKTIDELEANLVAAAVAAKLEAGELQKKEDVEAAVNAAKQAATNEAKEKYDADLAAERALAQRRDAAVQAHGQAATHIGRADLLAEDHDQRLAVFATRLGKVTELGLSPEKAPTAFAELAAYPLDDAGQASFDQRVKAIEELAGVKAGKPAPAAPAAPAAKTTPAATAPATVAASAGSGDSGDDAEPRPLVML